MFDIHLQCIRLRADFFIMSDFKIIECQFQDVDFEDSFFSSLAKDYSEFSDWIKKKAQEKCLIVKTDKIIGFLYVKLENEELKVDPIQPIKERLKIGTFKISPHEEEWDK